MATERLPAYERLIGRWSEARHRAALASGDFAYLIGLDSEGRAAGFAILRDLRDPSDNIGLQRIVAVDAAKGFGRPFLAAVIDWVFAETACHRLCLEVFTDNARARHVYRTLGFVEEGLLREIVKRRDGMRADQMLMSVLRNEWRGSA
jgi:RimJ/RimL family protein N-acetyltransferase